MDFYETIEDAITQATGSPFRILERSPIGGGCINRAEKLAGSKQSYFLKTNRASFLSRFDDEIAALKELAATGAVRIPTPIASGIDSNKSYLIMEYIEHGKPGKRSWATLGLQLAALHQNVHPTFGWNRDNAIGATQQRNQPGNDWVAFYREQRLGFQLELAAQNGFQLADRRALLESIPHFFRNYKPAASLLHGDLWSGNVSFDQQGLPFLFDPCCYYGDRETDLAFTEFFGGFSPEFYVAYNESYPLDSGYEQRKTLYNLYHCLNHYNLFGSPYDHQASAMASELLAGI